MMYWICHKLNFLRGASYIDSSGWIKKIIKNLKNKYDKRFQYATTVALGYEEINWNPERVWSIILLINKNKCKRMIYTSKIDD